jgi:hypothetical protein
MELACYGAALGAPCTWLPNSKCSSCSVTLPCNDGSSWSILTTSASFVVTQDKLGADQTMPAALIMMATGRKARTAGLGLEALGVQMDKAGNIQVRLNRCAWSILCVSH